MNTRHESFIMGVVHLASAVSGAKVTYGEEFPDFGTTFDETPERSHVVIYAGPHPVGMITSEDYETKRGPVNHLILWFCPRDPDTYEGSHEDAIADKFDKTEMVEFAAHIASYKRAIDQWTPQDLAEAHIDYEINIKEEL